MRAVAASAVRLPPVARVAPLTWAVVESAVAPGLALLARDATALQGEVAVSPTLRVALVRPGGHLAFRRSPGAGVSVVVCHGGPRVTETRAFEWTDDHDGLGATGTRDSGDAVQVPADAWWRVEPLGDAPVVVVHATHGPAMWVSHADHSSLPFFVYGTLRAGYRNHAVHLAGRPGVEFVGVATSVRPYVMLVGQWPLLLEVAPDGVEAECIEGEVYHVRDGPTRSLLNELEEGYRRQVVLVRLAHSGAEVAAVVYFGDAFVVDGFESAQELAVAGRSIKDHFPPETHWT